MNEVEGLLAIFGFQYIQMLTDTDIPDYSNIHYLGIDEEPGVQPDGCKTCQVCITCQVCMRNDGGDNED